MKSLFSASDHILIIGNKLVGDVVASLPIIYTLQRIYPSLKLSILGGSYTNDIYKAFGIKANIIDFDTISHYSQRRFSFTRFLDKIKILKKLDFEAGIAMPGGFEHALLLFLANIPIRIGSKTDYRSFLLTHHYPIKARTANHQIIKGVLDCLGIQKYYTPTYTKLPVDSPLNLQIQLFSDGADYCVVSPKASEPSKEWPVEYFVKLIEYLKQHHMKSVLLGTYKDDEQLEYISKQTGALNLAGKTNLWAVCEIINRANFFVGNDSGLAHIAGLLNAQSFILYGPTDFILTRPIGEKIVPIILNEPLAPPNQRSHHKNRALFKMSELSVKTVIQYIKTHHTIKG